MHFPPEHFKSTVAEPLHWSPPPFGAGLSHFLALDFLQLTAQVDQGVQRPHLPLTNQQSVNFQSLLIQINLLLQSPSVHGFSSLSLSGHLAPPTAGGGKLHNLFLVDLHPTLHTDHLAQSPHPPSTGSAEIKENWNN